MSTLAINTIDWHCRRIANASLEFEYAPKTTFARGEHSPSGQKEPPSSVYPRENKEGTAFVCDQCQPLYGFGAKRRYFQTSEVCKLLDDGRCIVGEGASGSVRIGVLHSDCPYSWRTIKPRICGTDLSKNHQPPLVAVKFVSVPVHERRRLQMVINEARLLRHLRIGHTPDSINAQPATRPHRVFCFRNVLEGGRVSFGKNDIQCCVPKPSDCAKREPSRPAETLPHGNLTACLAIVPAVSGTLTSHDKQPAKQNHCSHRVSFVLEYADGGTLQQYVEKVGPLQPAHASAILFAIIMGIDHLHNVLNTIHRDIKPNNVLLCREDSGVNARGPFLNQQLWRVKLADFGIAKTDADPKTVCGTRTYMAPEVRNAMLLSKVAESRRFARSNKGTKFTGTRTRYGQASDIYSLGVLSQFMLSGGVSSSLGAKWELTAETRNGNEADSSKASFTRISKSKVSSHFATWVVPARLVCACAQKNNATSSRGLCRSCGKITSSMINLCNTMTNNDPSRRPTLQQLLTHPAITENMTWKHVGLNNQTTWANLTFHRRSAALRNYLGSVEKDAPTIVSLRPGFVFEPASMGFIMETLNETKLGTTAIRELLREKKATSDQDGRREEKTKSPRTDTQHINAQSTSGKPKRFVEEEDKIVLDLSIPKLPKPNVNHEKPLRQIESARKSTKCAKTKNFSLLKAIFGGM